MKLSFVSNGNDISIKLKQFASEKLKPLEKRYPLIINAKIMFEKESVAATLLMEGAEIHATVKITDDKYHAIDALANKLLGLVHNHKEQDL